MTSSGEPVRARAEVRSGQPSKPWPIDHSPVGQLRSIRVRRKSTISAGVPSAIAAGSSWVSQIRLTSAASPPGGAGSSWDSTARSTAARGPVSAPGPELISVSEQTRAAWASRSSRATRPPKECPSRWMWRGPPFWLAPSASAIMATSAASAGRLYPSASAAAGLSYCPRMSTAITRRPARASGASTGRKSSLLPVYPGISSAGCRSAAPAAGSASSAANEPRSVSTVTRRTPSGSRNILGVLMGGRWFSDRLGAGVRRRSLPPAAAPPAPPRLLTGCLAVARDSRVTATGVGARASASVCAGVVASTGGLGRQGPPGPGPAPDPRAPPSRGAVAVAAWVVAVRAALPPDAAAPRAAAAIAGSRPARAPRWEGPGAPGLPEVLDLLGLQARPVALRPGQPAARLGRDAQGGVQVLGGGVGLGGVGEVQAQRLVDHLPSLDVGPVDEGDRHPGAAGPAGPADPVQVRLVIVGALVVHHVGDVLDVQAAGGHLGGHEHVHLAVAEGAQRAFPLGLAEIAVHGRGGEAADGERLGHLVGGPLGPAEHHGQPAPGGLQDPGQHLDLVHLMGAEDVLLGERHVLGLVMLLGTHVHRSAQVAPGERHHVAGHSGREEHGLPARRGEFEYPLHIGQEAQVEHLVGFVEHQRAHVG